MQFAQRYLPPRAMVLGGVMGAGGCAAEMVVSLWGSRRDRSRILLCNLRGALDSTLLQQSGKMRAS